jgi:hypothetical protein
VFSTDVWCPKVLMIVTQEKVVCITRITNAPEIKSVKIWAHIYYVCFPNEIFANFLTTLAVILIYLRNKYFIAKLITVQIRHYVEQGLQTIARGPDLSHINFCSGPGSQDACKSYFSTYFKIKKLTLNCNQKWSARYEF